MKFDISEYKESVKLLCQELKKNIIDFDIEIDEKINSVEISYPYKNETLAQYYEIELQRLCFETGFYKYITNEGSDYGPISEDKNIIPRRSYFYMLQNNYELWEDYEKEYINFKNNLKNITSKYDHMFPPA